MFHLLPPPLSPPPPTSTLPSAQGPGQMPVTLILKEAETKADEGNAVKRRRKGVGGGGAGGLHVLAVSESDLGNLLNENQ